PVSLPIRLDALVDTTLQDLVGKGDFSASPRSIYWSPVLTKPAILVEPTGILFVAMVRNRIKGQADTGDGPLSVAKPANDKSRFADEFAAFSKDMRLTASASFELSAGDLARDLVAIAKGYVVATLNTELQNPVCGTYKLARKFKPFSERVDFGEPKERF